MAATTEGLRERKKRADARGDRRRRRCRLFAERGFDAVTVAEVARAADVSEKTVFNYFPTKEDLAFAGREEGRAASSRRSASARPARPSSTSSAR